MLEYLIEEANRTTTENDAVTYSSTGSECLDLFATIGALRNADEQEIIDRFIRAYTENADAAMKLLFFARDIRGGLGERRVFRVIFSWLAKTEPESVNKNIQYVAEFGRYDDLLSLVGTACEKQMLVYLKTLFDEDRAKLAAGQTVSLLGKWLPSINASNADTIRIAKEIAKAFGLSACDYRKSVSALRARIQIIENNLRERNYSFEYEKQPSRALYKYRRAFARNDQVRYRHFLNRVLDGEATLHADQVAPYELVEPYVFKARLDKSYLMNLSQEEKDALNATWKSLHNYAGNENAIAVIDTSSSMYNNAEPIPAAIALSLGLYFAERNKGMFHQYFIAFSKKPQLIQIKGETFVDRLRYVSTFEEMADTNLEAVFDLIRNAAIKNHVPQEELPAKLIIISDMEFNSCVQHASVSNFENARKSYEEAGYKLPEIVFWNVASRNTQQPVKMNEKGVALVSGVTPRIFEMVANGDLSPYSLMMEVLESERYARIVK